MTQSVFVAIADALKSFLSDPPLAGQVAVSRDRQAPLGAQTRFAVNVRLDKTIGSSGGISGAPRDWATDYVVEAYARADAEGAPPTDVIDPLLCAVFERLSGASVDPLLISLGVQEVMPEPAIEWDLGEANTPQIVATLRLRLIHRTKSAQLAPW